LDDKFDVKVSACDKQVSAKKSELDSNGQIPVPCVRGFLSDVSVRDLGERALPELSIDWLIRVHAIRNTLILRRIDNFEHFIQLINLQDARHKIKASPENNMPFLET